MNKCHGIYFLLVGVLTVGFSFAETLDSEGDQVPGHGQTRAIFLLEDFEAFNLDDWTDLTSSCSAWVSDSGPLQGFGSLQITGACGHYGGLMRSLDNSQLTGISFMVRSNNTTSADTYVVVGDDNTTVDHGVVFFYAKTDGYWTLVSDGIAHRCAPYSGMTIYEVDWKLDWQWRTVSVWLDGEMCLAHVPFRSTTAVGLTQLHVYNYDAGPGWWDYFVISTPSITSQIFSDGFETRDADSWSSSVPSIPGHLYIYDGGTKAGAIGGRAGADVMCYQAAESNPHIPSGVMTRALISVNASDEIRDMPAKYGVPTDREVVGPTGTKIVDNWADLLDGNLDQSLLLAGVTSATNFWYSGSNWNGSVTAHTCSGWTSTAAADGWYGLTNQSDSDWIDISAATCGASTYHVLCLAWK